jgi:hypothetical protein
VRPLWKERIYIFYPKLRPFITTTATRKGEIGITTLVTNKHIVATICNSSFVTFSPHMGKQKENSLHIYQWGVLNEALYV